MEKEQLLQTPSQTVGPYFAYGLTPEQYHYEFKSIYGCDMIEGDHLEAITITGQIIDGKGNPISDAMIELWQNDGKNKSLGRCGTGTEQNNSFIFRTLKPNGVNGNAPFITAIIFMRGQLIHSYTRIYFDDEETSNSKDELLNSIDNKRRGTLLAKSTGPRTYQFNIHMQGEQETVFFAL